MKNRLKDLRNRLDLSAEDMANVLDISLGYYYKLERGEKRLNNDFNPYLHLFTVYLLCISYSKNTYSLSFFHSLKRKIKPLKYRIPTIIPRVLQLLNIGGGGGSRTPCLCFNLGTCKHYCVVTVLQKTSPA